MRRKCWRKGKTGERKWTIRKIEKITTNYLKTINKNETNAELCPPESCGNVPWKPPSPWTLSLSLHKQPQSFLIHKGSKDGFEETTLPTHIPGEMRISRQGQPQQLPRHSSLLSTLHTERHWLWMNWMKGWLPACSPRRQNQSQGHSPSGHSLDLQMFHLLQTGLSSRAWLCSTWGRSYCSGGGVEWRFTGHGWTQWS